MYEKIQLETYKPTPTLNPMKGANSKSKKNLQKKTTKKIKILLLFLLLLLLLKIENSDRHDDNKNKDTVFIFGDSMAKKVNGFFFYEKHWS